MEWHFLSKGFLLRGNVLDKKLLFFFSVNCLLTKSFPASVSWPTGRLDSLLAFFFTVFWQPQEPLAHLLVLLVSDVVQVPVQIWWLCPGMVTPRRVKRLGVALCFQQASLVPHLHSVGYGKDVSPALRVGSAAVWLHSGGAFVKIYMCRAPILGGKSVSRS